MADSAIDLVYLWVNGADPAWQAKRHAAFAKRANADDLARYGNVAGRYRDNGELKFNLRAIKRFFPQHGRVFIVSDGQRPAWLKLGADITFIDHAELIPATARPVFDAGHIESYLHHIPGLAERFIYLNDDVFFGSPVQPEAWFTPDGLAVYFEQQTIPDETGLLEHETALVNAAIYSRNWLAARFPHAAIDRHILAHSPRPMLKSALWELERSEPALFAAVRSTTFRSWRVPPIMSDLVLRWFLCQGVAAALKSRDAVHISSCDEAAEQQLADLQCRFGDVPFFCINDTCDDCSDDDVRLQKIANTLQQLLPTQSEYEC